jgi:hypothetical protein
MGTTISRRSLILPGDAGLDSPGVASGARPPAADGNLLSASDRAVSAVSASDSNFGSAVEALYPGLQNDPVFQQIAPLALLVTQQNGPTIRAYSVAWQITTPAGTYGTALFFYVSPGQASKGRSSSTLGTARQAILQAGQSRLITPFFNWSPTYYQRNPEPDWSTVITPLEPGGFLVSELSAATDVKVSLDGVVFSDWRILGPDQHNLARRLRSRRNGAHDEGLAVHRLLRAGAADSAIVATLQSHAAAARSGRRAGPGYWYQQSRRYQAQILLLAFEQADRKTFSKALHRLVHQKRTFVTRESA